MKLRFLAAVLVTAAALSACQQSNQPKLVLSGKSAVAMRAMQSRAFDTTDQRRTLRTIISTLQDLGYTIDKVEPAAGTVSATKLSYLRLTATTYARGASQTMVRANAIYKLPGQETQVDDPVFYQQLFFEPLAKAMFLAALQVEDPADPPPAATSTAPPSAQSAERK